MWLFTTDETINKSDRAGINFFLLSFPILREHLR